MSPMDPRSQSLGEEIANSISHGAGLVAAIAGGVAYTAGVAFFSLDSRWRYAHTIWHGFVMAGTGFHFFAILIYAG